MNMYTVCPRSSDPYYIVSYYTKWVTTSWTYSIKCCIHFTEKGEEEKKERDIRYIEKRGEKCFFNIYLSLPKYKKFKL